MATALQIIDRAYSLLGYKAAGEALSGADTVYALDVLNTLIDGWNTQNQFIISVNEVVANVAGVSATIGAGMTFNTVSPVDIADGAFSRLNGVDYPMEQINREQYAALTLKTVSSLFPQYFYYDSNIPAGRVYFYPVPAAAVEIHLPVSLYLTLFADIGTNYTLAPGYQKALAYSLAEELAPGIKDLSPMVMRIAANARRAIRRSNVHVAQLDISMQKMRFNVYSGD